MRNGGTMATGCLDVGVGAVGESTTQQQSGVLLLASIAGRLILQPRIKLHKHKYLSKMIVSVLCRTAAIQRPDLLVVMKNRLVDL